METLETIRNNLSVAMVGWMNMDDWANVLYIGQEDDAIPAMISCNGKKVHIKKVHIMEAVCLKSDDYLNDMRGFFDTVIAPNILEKSADPSGILKLLKSFLKNDGRMIIGCGNRLGIKYFCGDRDPYSGRSFDGIEDYRHVPMNSNNPGRLYDRSQIEAFLDEAGLFSRRFYSAMPDAYTPLLIYAEDYLPNEDLSIRYFPSYNSPETIFMEEAFLYEGLIRNGLFHVMANSFIIECAPEDRLSKVLHVTASSERSREDALYTIIRRDGVVEKKAIYPEAMENIRSLSENIQALKARGIGVVEGQLKGNSYIMPYIEAESGQKYLRRIFRENLQEFISAMDEIRDIIYKSSEQIPVPGDWDTELREKMSTPHFFQSDNEKKLRSKGLFLEKNNPGNIENAGVWLEYGYFDLVPLNSFHTDEGFIFYDQEFRVKEYPANAILARIINNVYAGQDDMNRDYPAGLLYERYGLDKELSRWWRFNGQFLNSLRNELQMRSYHETIRAAQGTINLNRQKINYSYEEYQRLFTDIFRGLPDKKLFVFGTGNYASIFLQRYGNNFDIEGVLDNNKEVYENKVGDLVRRFGSNIKISTDVAQMSPEAPDVINGYNNDEYKVIICVKNYMPILQQLQKLGAKDIGIYDPFGEYPLVQYQKESKKTAFDDGSAYKKYHIGYVSGVFDLFHSGHINLLRRAKEQCDYLIVGIVSDEGVRNAKRTEPAMPYSERAAVVRACRYVDRVEEVPPNAPNSDEAYLRYHFDAQFCGSDYVNNPHRMAEKAFLEKHGASLVILPYTEGVSSSDIKERMRQNEG